MTQIVNVSISEKIIEDILSTDKSLLAELLSVNFSDLSLVARQKILNSGRLDLLFLYNDELLLLEIKVVRFTIDIIEQINSYHDDLLALQKQNKLIKAKIRKIILINGFSSQDLELCKVHSIELINYEPKFVLRKYYENFKELTYFLQLQSGDYGVVRIGLIKSTLYLLSQGKNLNELSRLQSRSKKTIRNRLSVAGLLNLVLKHNQQYYLTDFGNSFINAVDSDMDDRLSLEQVELLASFIIENPFYSSITYSIISIIESVFVLAKNTYPVPHDSLKEYFVTSVGKTQTWQTLKAQNTATYIFSNYACELGFLTKYDNSFYITPKGIQAVLILQLNRSIRLIESKI